MISFLQFLTEENFKNSFNQSDKNNQINSTNEDVDRRRMALINLANKRVDKRIKDLKMKEINFGFLSKKEKNFMTEINSDSITTIGPFAFKDCISLTTADFPKAENLESDAFARCESLSSVNLPLIKIVGNDAFDDCWSLVNVNIPLIQAVGGGAFRGCESLLSINLENVTTIGPNAFWNCKSLSNVRIPKIEEIKFSTFQWCKSFTRIDLPSVKYIDYYAFQDCSSLKDVYFSDKIESIDQYVFQKCKDLTVHFPKGFDKSKIEIYDNAFEPTAKFVYDSNL